MCPTQRLIMFSPRRRAAFHFEEVFPGLGATSCAPRCKTSLDANRVSDFMAQKWRMTGAPCREKWMNSRLHVTPPRAVMHHRYYGESKMRYM